ncbi:TetR/AcrR family transcriptional regulator [uncultured Amphritea sp.]|mgnify:CR=1 FL=1|uniref:TetR/AcrR family transcriptional regulator n=1 Tax=uncultured Amphritea sp. TaxID=981605 RepID=UPI00260A415F|nr:TetR/AcrR family transcriptional regulator [uncultured Amphritea sp.]
MPYSSEHKQKSRERILQSAYRLFSTKGFDAVTVDAVMQDCSLTRGAFYGHFTSKSELYKEALTFAASNSKLAEIKPEGLSPREWLSVLLDGYLSVEHVSGERPCPLAFLATDVVSRDKETNKTYARVYRRMNQLILDYAGRDSVRDEQAILSLTSMIIGAVAVSRTLEDKQLVQQILSSCRQQTRLLLGGI